MTDAELDALALEIKHEYNPLRWRKVMRAALGAPPLPGDTTQIKIAVTDAERKRAAEWLAGPPDRREP